ncbi:MAG: hypothetical protein QM582_17825, partial [Micropruina sp.]|uniref:hypothetical protein n=1 Tax=Micropruina sp. TaxID=2737536 RepID=UPI0039E2BF91
ELVQQQLGVVLSLVRVRSWSGVQMKRAWSADRVRLGRNRPDGRLAWGCADRPFVRRFPERNLTRYSRLD